MITLKVDKLNREISQKLYDGYYSPITAYPGTPEYLYVENSCQYLFEKSFRNF